MSFMARFAEDLPLLVFAVPLVAIPAVTCVWVSRRNENRVIRFVLGACAVVAIPVLALLVAGGGFSTFNALGLAGPDESVVATAGVFVPVLLYWIPTLAALGYSVIRRNPRYTTQLIISMSTLLVGLVCWTLVAPPSG